MIRFKEFILESEKKGQGYGCLMLILSSEHKKTFNKIFNQIDDDDLYGVEDGYGKETEPHVTVKYGLHENDHDKIFDILGKIDPITIKLKSPSLFENEKYDVLKMGVSSPELRSLNSRVCRIFEYTDKYKDYNPHVTIAYLKPGMGKKYLKLQNDIIGKDLTLSRLCFSDDKTNKKYKKLSK